MNKRICALILIFLLMISSALCANAAQADITSVNASPDLGVVAADYPEVGTQLETDDVLPSSYSNRDLATPVRNQRYNTCWAYSSTAVLEIAAAKAGIYNGSFSPMHMNYWAANRNADDESDYNSGWQRNYSAAGYPYIALGYLTSMIGAVTEDAFPSDLSYEDYLALEGPIDPSVSVNSLIYLKGGDIDTIKTAVREYGAVVGNLHYDGNYLNAENAAYYCDLPGLETRQLNGHAVAIVGWDDNFSRENFNEGHLPENDGAWLCKNSWGTSWSNIGGYFWMSYEDMYLFDKRFGPSYAIIGLEEYSENKKLYQNEIYGATYEFDYISEVIKERTHPLEQLTYVNVYDFGGGFNTLDKVYFETTAVGADYDIYYIPMNDEVPTENENKWTLLASGTVDYQGYICSDFENLDVPDGKAGIGVRIKRTADCEDLTIGSSEWLTVGGRYVFRPNAKKGDCYIIGYHSTPLDVMDFYQNSLDDDIGGTFVIKAIAQKTRTSDIMGDVDLDLELTILDCTKIQRYIAALEGFNANQKQLADYDGDEEITILDCTKIQRILAGIDDPLYPAV